MAKRRREPTRYDAAILIHLCKDGTLTYRTRDQLVFNGRALPICSVDTPEQAEQVLVRFGKKQWAKHPLLPTQDWYRLAVLPNGESVPEAGLEFEHIEPISDWVTDFIVSKLGVVYGG